jgi:murein DD-endopeptidase MepM/ murein hydrolase activator NlpD
VRSRHVAIAGTTVRVYCSEACLRAKDALPPAEVIEPPRRRAAWWIAGGLVVGTSALALVYRFLRDDSRDGPSEQAVIEAFERAANPPPPAVEAPAAPQPTADEAADAALLEELARDAWIHPLAGPTRRMPTNHDAAFGALRPGDRPPECASGHCGVDIGDTWGEPVHAVHDGVVEWVNRGPNEDHGGIFVKIAHRGGALYSWYFHLAAVPRWVQPGVKIKAGQVIALLGDTGVGHSGPHLHFSLSVKVTKNTERYLDPEPLIAIWPLWIPNENRPTTEVAPGLPMRERNPPKQRRAVEVDAGVTEEAPTSAP